jgi:hypothetical protein
MFSIQVGFEQRKRFQARAMEIQHVKSSKCNWVNDQFDMKIILQVIYLPTPHFAQLLPSPMRN